MDARSAIGLAHDLQRGWQAVHHRRGERRQLLRRLPRLQSADIAIRLAAAGRLKRPAASRVSCPQGWDSAKPFRRADAKREAPPIDGSISVPKNLADIFALAAAIPAGVSTLPTAAQCLPPS